MSSQAYQSNDAQAFLDDLITREVMADILGMKPESMSVMHCRGTLPLTRYRRGRKTFYSRSEGVELIKAGRIPPSA